MFRTELLLILPLAVAVTIGQTNRGYTYYGTSNVRDQRPQPIYGRRPLVLPLRPMPVTGPVTAAPVAPVPAEPAPVHEGTEGPVAPPEQPAPSYTPALTLRPIYTPVSRPILPQRPIRPAPSVVAPSQPPTIAEPQPTVTLPPIIEATPPVKPVEAITPVAAPEPAAEQPEPTPIPIESLPGRPVVPVAVEPVHDHAPSLLPPASEPIQPSVVSEHIPRPEPIREPLTRPEAIRQPEPISQPKPIRQPEPAQGPEPIRQPEPVEEPETTRQPEPISQPKPVQEPEPIPQPEPVHEPEPIRQPEPVLQPEPISRPEPIRQPEPVQEPEPVLEPEPISLPKPVQQPEPVSQTKPNPLSEQVQQPEPVQQPEIVSQPELVRESESVQKPKPALQDELAPQPEPSQEIDQIVPVAEPQPRPVAAPQPTSLTPVAPGARSVIVPQHSQPVALPPLLPKPKPVREPAFGRHPPPMTYSPITLPPPTPSYYYHPTPARTVATQPPPVVTHITPPVTQAPRQLKLDFQCKEENGYYSVEHECDTYIECKQGRAMKYACPDGLHFNPATKRFEYPCAYPSEVKCIAGDQEQKPNPTGKCPNQYGFYSMNDGDCSRFIMCQEGLATIMNCPMGLVFNPQTSSCDWPANVPQCNPSVFKDFTCPDPPEDEDGQISDIIFKYRYHADCKLYIACQLGRPRLLSCERGLSFDDASQSCIDEDYVSDCAVPYHLQ